VARGILKVDTFPTLAGIGWPITKAPKFATRIQTAISGRELRVLDQPLPIWEWTLPYTFLRDMNDVSHGTALGAGYDELRTLMGFFLRQQGSFQTFLYNDPTDNSVQNQNIGGGNNVNQTFQLTRTFGGFVEPITQPIAISVYLSGPGGFGPVAFNLLPNGVVSLLVAPAPGEAVIASFTYNWPVRFSEDTESFENFMYQLWELKQLKFQSVILP
jgi:uncharacterized protein (TIGR02217 family)